MIAYHQLKCVNTQVTSALRVIDNFGGRTAVVNDCNNINCHKGEQESCAVARKPRDAAAVLFTRATLC